MKRTFGIWLAWFSVACFLTAYAQIDRLTGQDWLLDYTPPFTFSTHRTGPLLLGAEHRNVAVSLYENHRFADPFGDPTGPTAWVAPLFPFVLAAGLFVSGGSVPATAVMEFVLQCVIIACIACWITLIASAWRATWAAVFAMSVLFATDFRYLFQVTHDSVLLAGVLTLVIGVAVGVKSFKQPRAFLWGAAGGVGALASPGIGLCWGVLHLWMFRSVSMRFLILSALVAFFLVMPWLVRNAVVFGALIPIKSNAGYESYQAYHDERHGIVTMKSVYTHPYHAHTDHGRRFRELGELAFVAEKASEFRRSVNENPMQYWTQVGNRLAAATVELPQEIEILKYSKFHQVCWWLYPLAFFGFLGSLVAPPKTSRTVVGACQVAYVAHLVPYIGVSFYIRYALPLLFVRGLFVCYLLVLIQTKSPRSGTCVFCLTPQPRVQHRHRNRFHREAETACSSSATLRGWATESQSAARSIHPREQPTRLPIPRQLAKARQEREESESPNCCPIFARLI